MTETHVDARRRVKSMVRVPGGGFLMGSEGFYPEERPVRRVEVDGFWMDDHPVTVAEFRAFVRASGYVTVAERPLDPAEFPAHRRRTWSPAPWCSPEHRGRSISDT